MMSASDTPIGHGLNPSQKEAVLYLNGPCLVLAGAGSGKTRVITQKIAYLLRDCGYMGRNVAALTFTNKAAREMAERVKTLVDPKLAKGLTISTFHALGVRFLREEAAQAGLKPQFSILDSDDAMGIIQELLATTDRGRLREVQSIISLWKNQLVSPDQAAHAAQADTVRGAGIVQARREVGHVLDGVDADQVTPLGGEGRDGDRHVLQALLPLLGGDHQFLDGVADRGAGRPRRLRLGRSGHEAQGQGSRRKKPRSVEHLYSPHLCRHRVADRRSDTTVMSIGDAEGT